MVVRMASVKDNESSGPGEDDAHESPEPHGWDGRPGSSPHRENAKLRYRPNVV